MKENKGITLIILILTVTILAILVLLSFDLVVDKKLFSKSNNTVEKANNKLAQDQNVENSLLESWDETIGVAIKTGTKAPPCKEHKYGEWQEVTQATCTTAGSKTRTCTVCGTTQTKTSGVALGHNYVNGTCTVCGEKQIFETKIQAGTKATENIEYTDSTGNKAIIPAGFTVSGKESEKTISEGLVIYLINDKTDDQIAAINWEDEIETLKQTYDQFVWIPVTDVNSMFMCQSKTAATLCTIELVDGTPTCTTHSSTQMAGRLYATSYGNDNFDSSLTTQTYNANSGLREPAIVTDYDGSSSVNNIGLTLATLQAEYISAVAKVIKSKGFWIGRYETSGMNSSSDDVEVNVVAGKGTSDGIDYLKWYRMYKQQQNYASKKLDTTKIQSTMVFGAAWDQTMIFANCATSTTTPIEDHSTVKTGNVETDCYKNIYDLCGNLNEWTTEVINEWTRVYRGGRYEYSNSASSRIYGSVYNLSQSDWGLRF